LICVYNHISGLIPVVKYRHKALEVLFLSILEKLVGLFKSGINLEITLEGLFLFLLVLIGGSNDIVAIRIQALLEG